MGKDQPLTNHIRTHQICAYYIGMYLGFVGGISIVEGIEITQDNFTSGEYQVWN